MEAKNRKIEHKCACGKTIPQCAFSTIQPKKCPLCTYRDAYNKAKDRRKKSKFELSGKSDTNERVKGKTILKKPKNYLELADTWFSRFIRIKYGFTQQGEHFCRDIITGKIYLAKNIDNGHFYSRYHMATRYDECNCRPQNRSSNRFSGEKDKITFQKNLIAQIGQDEFDRITQLAHNSTMKYGDSELKQIAEDFRKKTKELIKERNAKKWW